MNFNRMVSKNQTVRLSLLSLCFASLVGFSGCASAPLASQTNVATNQAAIAATTNTNHPMATKGAIAQVNSDVASNASYTVAQRVENRPKVATVENMYAGDLMCYVTLVDDEGVRHEDVPATFEVCEQTSLLNQRVNLGYTQASVADCDITQPCDRSQLTTLISEMTLISQAASAPPAIEAIGGDASSASYRMTINNPSDIVYVYCPENYAPKLSYLRNVEAIQCEPF
jgi:hypothetical protein